MVDALNNLGNIGNISNITSLSSTSGPAKSNEIFINKSEKVDPNFERFLSKIPLDDRIPNKSSLAKLGFNVPFPGIKIGDKEIPEQEFLLDMNGGKTYQNKNGDTIRICSFDGELALGTKGANSVEYKSKDGNLANKVYYDPDGNPVKGSLTVKNYDGSTTSYQYEYDIDGNKKITSMITEYPKND